VRNLGFLTFKGTVCKSDLLLVNENTITVLDLSCSKMQKQVLVTKEYIVNYPDSAQTAVAKAKKGTLEPTDLITKVVIVEGGAGASGFLTASELAEILDMHVGHHTNRTRTTQLH